MKPDIHPEYGPVAFRDISTGRVVVTRSTLVSRPARETIEVDGRALPVWDVEVTSDSHPFWTGRQRVMDTEGRVSAFQRRYGTSR
jgi:large subunit ribosomal protein L31